MTKVLFLYAEMVPSWLPTFQVLTTNYSSEVDVVYWDKEVKTPYVPPSVKGVNYLARSSFSSEQLVTLANDGRYDIIFVSGWMDKGYMKAIYSARKRGVPVVTGFDDWWKGTIKQRLLSFCPKWIRKKFYSHAWVAGPRQYEYAKRIGFSDAEVIYNLLTCDTTIFRTQKIKKREPIFVYVGRFSPEKGIDVLANAYKIYKEELNGTWGLTCIGNGPLKPDLEVLKDVELLPFSSASFIAEKFAQAGAFVMPSHRDFFGLVVQESACSGLPLILSSNVGAASVFGIHNYNAFIFESGSAIELANRMKQMESMDCEERVLMGKRSLELSYRNSPEVCAASFLSAIEYGYGFDKN
ncbi:glycosyltransferase family 4 protein [Vibrio vulnificus]|nr:glycosyltransferase family 4 protein [Vibrio vulnificus]